MKYTYRCGFGETFVVDTDKPTVYYDTNAPTFIALGAILIAVIVAVLIVLAVFS